MTQIFTAFLLAALLLLPGGAAFAQEVDRADPTPVPLPGTVMLHGEGMIMPDTLKTFYERGGNTGRVVIITAALHPPTAEKQAAGWAARKLRKAPFFPLYDPTGELHEALGWTAAVWIEGTGGTSAIGALTAANDGAKRHRAETVRLLLGVLERGGVVGGAAEEFVALFGEQLLPGVEVSRDPKPGKVGYHIGLDTAAAIIGRHSVVRGRGSVIMTLPRSSDGARGPRDIELSGDRRADHVAWRRAAMARKAGGFPPAEFPALEPLEGTIVVIGGGRVPKRGLEAFISASGGKGAPIAVINTALGDPPPRTAADLGAFDTLGATNTYLLHAPTRADAASEEFIAQLDRAGGVWFTGGRQWRLVDRYLDTAVVDALRRVLARGGAVGGTSAGATICGDYLVRGDPLTNRTVMAEGYERGFALLPGLAIDQHFDSRKRLPDLVALKRHYPQLLAIGLDETTAAIITGTKMRIAGLGKVTVLDRPLPAGEPKPGDHYTVLNRGDQFDLKKREVVFRWPLGDR